MFRELFAPTSLSLALIVTGSAHAAAINTNPSFEDDPIGTTGTITGWNIQDGVTATVVASTIGEGSQALEITADTGTVGAKTDAVQTKLGSSFGNDTPLLTVGETYIVSGTIKVLAGTGSISFYQQNSDPQRLWIGSQQGGLYTSEDAGQTWRNIFTVGVHSVSYDSESGTLVAGTASGVYQSNDSGRNWISLSDGFLDRFFPTVAIKEDLIVAGTKGNGILRRKLSNQ